MANYQNTLILDAIANLTDGANKDMRAPSYGATQAFSEYKRDVIVNYDEFNLVENKSELQDKKIDYLRRDSQSLGTARSASLTGAMGDSTRDSLTWVTYTREFTISDSVMRQNRIAAQRIMENQLRNARLDIGAGIETDAVTKLEAFKNTVQGSRNLGTWDSSNYVSEIAFTNKTEYFNYIATEMRTLDYNGMLQEIHTANANALINYQVAQGQANSANLQFQYPDFEFYTSSSVTNLSDYFCTSYVVPAQTLALVDWIPGKNREGVMDHADWDFTQMPDPFGIFDRLAIAVQKKVQNSTSTGYALNGTSQDMVWLYEMSVDVAFYIPTITTGKVVNKYGLVSS